MDNANENPSLENKPIQQLVLYYNFKFKKYDYKTVV